MKFSRDEIEREEERGRGILSGPDRKWLLMDRESFEEEHTPQYWGQRRDELQNRVRNAFLDFTLLFEHLDDEERKPIFSPDSARGPEFEAAIEDAVAFMLSGHARSFGSIEGLDYPPALSAGGSGPHSGGLLYVLGAALRKVYLEYDMLLESGELQIEATRIPKLASVKKKLESGETLHPRMAALLVQSGAIDSERLTELAREELLEESEAAGEEVDEGGSG